MVSLLLALTLGGTAHADEQTLTYRLLVNGTQVGTRELTVRYLPSEEVGGPETRLLKSVMELDGAAVGVPVKLKIRASAHFGGGTEGFVATVFRNGKTWQVQGDQATDGSWEVRKRQGAELAHWSLRRSEVDLSSLGFVDPQRTRVLDGATSAKVLMVETGQVWSGAWASGGRAELQVGGQSVDGAQWRWSPEEGPMAFTRGHDGLLLRYATVVLGHEVVAELLALPEPRSFGDIDVQDFDPAGTGLREEEL